jgi:serine/threonine-protein kinase RsbW
MSEPIASTWSAHRILPSDTAIAAEFTNELVDAMTDRNLGPRDVFRVQLAFDEAIVNAIRHGNRVDPSKTVDVSIDCNCKTVHIRIADQGPGFDPARIPDPRESELLDVPGGRGVLLISELMTHVDYNRVGNEIRMTKIRNDKSDSDEEE